MGGLYEFERDVFRVAFDLSGKTPFPKYATKNPVNARRAYYELFDARWYMAAPGTTRKLRNPAENARWHFCDWFLGEGIRLSYAGAGRLGGSLLNPAVERVYVDDRKYGRHFEAFFDRESGFLLAMHEKLMASERDWFQQKFFRKSPVWVTHYRDYREVGGVLFPHQWSRAVTSVRKRVDLHFNIAINGAAPDTIAPEL